MKELWIGVVEVLTEPSPGIGNTLAFTTAVAWADTAADYVDSVTSVLSGYGWTMLSVENIRSVASDAEFSDEVTGMIEQAKADPNACILGSFHYYPSRAV